MALGTCFCWFNPVKATCSPVDYHLDRSLNVAGLQYIQPQLSFRKPYKPSSPLSPNYYPNQLVTLGPILPVNAQPDKSIRPWHLVEGPL